MPLNDVLLPKHVSDACYASLMQIYIDMFQVTSSSNLFTLNRNKQRVTVEHKVLSLDRPKKLNQVVELYESEKSMYKNLGNVEQKNYRSSWHL